MTSERRTRLAVAATLAAATVYYVVFVARTAFSFEGRSYFALFDDSAISMQYARNFAHGHGLVWNAGEHIEGYSNLLWTLWMSVVHLVGVSDRYTALVVMVSAGALLIATLVVVRRLADAIVPGARHVGLIPMAMTPLFYPLVFWALRGTEVALAALLVTLAALLAVRLQVEWTTRRAWALGVTIAAAVLTRDDLVVPCAVMLAWLAWKGAPATRRRALLVAAGAVAVIAAHEIFRLGYYGDALPNTYYLKLQGLGLGERLATGAEGLFYTALNSLPAVLVLGGVALAVRRRSAAVQLLAALFAVQCLYSVYVGGDAWEDVRFANRFFATAAPVLMVLAGIGIHELRRREVAWRAAIAFAVSGALLLVLQLAEVVPHRRLGITDDLAPQVAPALLLLSCAAALMLWLVARAPAALAAVAVALLAVAAGSAEPTSDWARSNAQDAPLEQAWAEIGRVVGRHTAPGTRVAFVLAGNMAYFADRRGVDLLGKMDSVVAHEKPTTIEPIRFRPGHNKWDYAHSIGALRPQVITSLWFPTAGDLCDLRAWGYDEVARGFYVLRGTSGVDVPGLRTAIARVTGTSAARLPPPRCP